MVLGRQLERLAEERSLARANWLLALPRTGRLAIIAFLLFASAMATVPTTYLPPIAAWPVGRWLAYASGGGGRRQGSGCKCCLWP